jgi:hypothetical protein
VPDDGWSVEWDNNSGNDQEFRMYRDLQVTQPG